MAEIIDRTFVGMDGQKYLELKVIMDKWEFRENISVTDDYRIDENSKEYKLAESRLIENMKSKNILWLKQ